MEDADAWVGPLLGEDQSFVLVYLSTLYLLERWSLFPVLRMLCRRRFGVLERMGK